jgi:hypothetical protein
MEEFGVLNGLWLQGGILVLVERGSVRERGITVERYISYSVIL